MKGISRRELLQMAGAMGVAGRWPNLMGKDTTSQHGSTQALPNDEPSGRSARLPGTEPLTMEGDLAAQMVEGIHRFLLRETGASIARRQDLWSRDFSSVEAYNSSILPNRKRFGKIIGVIDERVTSPGPTLEALVGGTGLVSVGTGYKVYAVRWPVLPGVDAEGLLLQPSGGPVARVVALPDADWSPEMLVGLAHGVSLHAQFARRLAENGCLVLVPVLINREDTWSGSSDLGLFTNEPHREYIYRMAYELGRHVIGYEVQKVLAAVDWFSRSRPTRPIGVVGYGEGGLLALYSAAFDTRIDAALVSGYFQSRQGLWTEPIYRNVWSLLHEFGDAELASLVAPRALVVEACRGPEVAGPPPATGKRRRVAASGKLVTPPLSSVKAEVGRAQPFFQRLDAAKRISLVVSGYGEGTPGCDEALRAFLSAVGSKGALTPLGPTPRDQRLSFDPLPRLYRQFQQLVEFTQTAVFHSEKIRRRFWRRADASSVGAWKRTTAEYHQYFWEEVIGRLPDPSEPMVARSRQAYEGTHWRGYEIVLPVWPDIFAYGILLLPKSIQPGERRPVVVCQHGLEGRPRDLIEATSPEAVGYYHRFAATLADRGFVIYCPQNPYIGDEKFRILQRLGNPLKASLFSVILGQHQRTLEWLADQPFVDPERIGFYGLSYGGKTALRVPPLLHQYALSICSGDFNEWIWKVCRDDAPFTYPFTKEYDVLEFNLGNTFNHSDMAKMMTPRPFMVERGHNDGVSVDSWVAYEYAKVRRHYDLMDLSDRSRIEFFNGPHTIHGVGTFKFLHHFLNWPEPEG